MLFVDTHTHLYDEAFAGEMDQAVERAISSGVEKMILPDIDSKTRDEMFLLASRFPGVLFPAIGLHPTEVGANWREELDKVLNFKAVAELSTSDPMAHDNSMATDEAASLAPNINRIVAVGEVGMDLYWSTEFRKEQEEVFRAQIELSLREDLPLIIHVREATQVTLDILKDYSTRGLRGVFHAFGGSIETFREIQRLGDFYVGIGGVVTFKKASIGETVKEIPLERILTETDSPYLTPVPHRGQRNESSYIPIIAKKIAEQKGEDLEKVARITRNNAYRLFNL